MAAPGSIRNRSKNLKFIISDDFPIDRQLGSIRLIVSAGILESLKGCLGGMYLGLSFNINLGGLMGSGHEKYLIRMDIQALALA